MQIRPLDAADPAAMAAWHASYHAAHVFGQEYPSPWMLEEMRAEMLGDRTGERMEPFGLYVDGRCVSTGFVELPLMDNRHLARVEVATHPDHRGRGYASALLEHLTAVAVSHGRSTLNADAAWSVHGRPDGVGTPNADFLTRHGFSFSLGDVKRALDLPADEALLGRLAAEAATRHPGYRLRDFVGPVPEDLLDEFGALIGSLITEAPMGDLDFEPEVFDAARIRADEEVFAASGRTKYTTVAVAPDGALVAYSELAVPSYDPEHVYQWGTLVRPAHRGHRLGLATKVHNLRRFQAAESGRSLLFTYNAEVNTHMVAVNEAMGFRPVQRLGEFQKRL
ncbi:GNAT family N-acetyltransferase [Nocardioides panacis]|uniref:GNAT family N-acetyltransferase n=1 Tax=Nocardioides panacis TaxID=2849501 RepID=A0A975SW15_9ACTN|nr:GNAT family N-acetyltransferase [Nocardioides panacis]QWZ06928.1 GNAT family N-acetyltransferase [Nocardioides panacis]